KRGDARYPEKRGIRRKPQPDCRGDRNADPGVAARPESDHNGRDDRRRRPGALEDWKQNATVAAVRAEILVEDEAAVHEQRNTPARGGCVDGQERTHSAPGAFISKRGMRVSTACPSSVTPMNEP